MPVGYSSSSSGLGFLAMVQSSGALTVNTSFQSAQEFKTLLSPHLVLYVWLYTTCFHSGFTAPISQ